MITLTYQDTTLELSDRLDWVDELSWSDLEQETEYATDGTLLVHQAFKLSGRTIELNGEDTQAWLDRATCLQIYQWRRMRGARFTLLLRGQARTVIFDIAQSGGFQARPIWKLVEGEITPQLMYRPNFWFIEVNE